MGRGEDGEAPTKEQDSTLGSATDLALAHTDAAIEVDAAGGLRHLRASARATSFGDVAPTMIVGRYAVVRRLGSGEWGAVYEVGEFEGQAFIAMAPIDGVTLREWAAASPRPWRAETWRDLAVLRFEDLEALLGELASGPRQVSIVGNRRLLAVEGRWSAVQWQ